MNRINQLFQDSPKNLLSIYFCAGCPTLEGTADVIRTLERNGVHSIEIGIPFSDPMADGIVIQEAATRALRNGMSLRILFEQLRDIRNDVRIPLILMGYLNPIMKFGFEAFCQKCVECGIDGVIIPDLPFKDYEETYKPIADRCDIRVIMLITPKPARLASAKSTNIPTASSIWCPALLLPVPKKISIARSKLISKRYRICTCAIPAWLASASVTNRHLTPLVPTLPVLSSVADSSPC